MQLEELSLNPPAILISFLEDLGEGENGFGGSKIGQPDFSLADYLQSYCDLAIPDRVKPGNARQSNFWVLDDDNTVIGMLKIRHELTVRTETSGGHIGYYIHREYRGRGFGKRALGLGLAKLKTFGVNRALITIYPENTASIKVALAAGAVFEDTVTDPGSSKAVNRYWVDLDRSD